MNRCRMRTATIASSVLVAAIGTSVGGDPGAAARAQPPSAPKADWATFGARRLPLLAPCTIGNLEERLLCGTLKVWENRATASGRRIPLRIVVVPAQSAEPPDDPVFVFEGGPGGAATGRAIGSAFSGPVRARDIVLVDQRGTGSHPIQCDLGRSESGRPGTLREMFPVDEVRACAARLAEGADPRLYGTADHADDIEEVRRRLGYGPINLRGGSYGSDAMMVFAQRHPKSVRTLFGIGVSWPLRSNLAERGQMAEQALERITALCSGDEVCASLTPSLHEQIATLLSRLEKPITVALDDPRAPRQRLQLKLSREWIAEMIRLELYFAFTTRALPWAVHRAHDERDWQPLARLSLFIEDMFRSTLSYGVLLTVHCAEHLDFDVEAALAKESQSLFGNYRLEQQLAGCSAWPHERRPALGVAVPRVLDIPTLFVSGALDPVTPPTYAEEARALFPNSKHLVLPEGQHGPFDLDNGWACIHEIWAQLLEQGSIDGLDLSCSETMRRPRFLRDGTEFTDHLRELASTLE